jgi:hypothetical protein
MGIKGMEGGGCMDTMPTPCCMGLTAFRFTPRNSVRAWAAGDSAGDGWGQPELSVLVVGGQIGSVDGRRLGTALGTVGGVLPSARSWQQTVGCSRLTETDGVPLRSTQLGARLGRWGQRWGRLGTA